MKERKPAPIYPAINRFKLLAALLVIAIHTSPLTSFSAEADFVLTQILARVAVPFFFMVSGYFVLPRAIVSSEKMLRYLKRIAFLYLEAVLLYLPIGIYAGHFRGAGPLTLLKMLIFDGTFYHLWYLPALLLGFCLMVLLLKKLPLPTVGILTSLLYLIGLFGDSYYGFLPNGSIACHFYQGMFQLFSFTRNGFFFSPIFLLLGYLLTVKKRPGLPVSLAGIGISAALLLAEGITLHLLNVQRHGSMYVFLLPLMYFLFSALLCGRGRDFTAALPKDLPLFLYLLHPLCIILVRGAAKITHLNLLVDNSLLHYLAVVLSTFMLSLFLLKLKNILNRKKAPYDHKL